MRIQTNFYALRSEFFLAWNLAKSQKQHFYAPRIWPDLSEKNLRVTVSERFSEIWQKNLSTQPGAGIFLRVTYVPWRTMVEYEAFDVFATAAEDSLVAAQGVQVRGSCWSSFAWGLISGQQVVTPYLAAMVVFFTALCCCMYHNERYCTLLAYCRCTCRVICNTAVQPNSSCALNRPLFSRYRLNHDYHTALSFTVVIMGCLALSYPWVPRYATVLEGLFIACPFLGYVHERRKWHSVYRAVHKSAVLTVRIKWTLGFWFREFDYLGFGQIPGQKKNKISAA